MKTAKNLIQKAIMSSSDPYLALLDWRNTPTEGLDNSPAQRLFSRRTRTLLPTTNSLLKPQVPENIIEKIKQRQAKQAFYFNAGTKELSNLNVGDNVRVKPLHNAKPNTPWVKATVQGKVDIRSYQVRTEDGRVYRRNRRHLFDSKAPSVTTQNNNADATEPLPAREQSTIEDLPADDHHTQQQPEGETKTRYGRSIKPPSYLKDYQT